MMSTVLVALDGSEKDQRAIPAAAALADVAGGDLHVIRVVDSPLEPLPPRAQARADAEQRLSIAADRLRDHGVTAVRVRVLEADDPATAINRAVREELVDFIAMSTRGSGGLNRFVLGSVAERLVRDSDVPVLLGTPRSEAERS